MPPTRKSRLASVTVGTLCSILAVTGATLAVSPTAGSGGSKGDSTSAAPRSVLASVPVVDTHLVRIERDTKIAASTPQSVLAGRTIVVRGVVKVRSGKKAKPRLVQMLERNGTGWTRVSSKKSTRAGVFVLALPSGSAARTRTFEVRAARSAGLAAAKVRVSVKVVKPQVAPPLPPPVTPPVTPPVSPPATPPMDPLVTPLPGPLGSPTDWGYSWTGGGRWNPCQAIGWSYDAAGGYDGAQADMETAFAALSARTGLRFVQQDADSASISVGWSTAALDPALNGGVVGYARTTASTVPGKDVAYRIVKSSIRFDSDHALRQGFFTSGSPSWGQVMLHEALHALGLTHASGPEQVMHASVNPLNHRFGAGDLTGMTQVGTAKPCL